jgi:hypothetical protein
MPLEKKGGESKNDFISRCISHEAGKHPEQKNDQNVAICESIWSTFSKNEFVKDVIRKMKDLKKKKKC